MCQTFGPRHTLEKLGIPAPRNRIAIAKGTEKGLVPCFKNGPCGQLVRHGGVGIFHGHKAGEDARCSFRRTRWKGRIISGKFCGRKAPLGARLNDPRDWEKGAIAGKGPPDTKGPGINIACGQPAIGQNNSGKAIWQFSGQPQAN